jgi:hypothetical protein
MEDDDGDWAGRESVLIPLSLIQALSDGLLRALDEWQEERGIDGIHADRCLVAMAAAVSAAMESLTIMNEGVTLQ